MCKASYFPNNRTVVVKGFLSEGDANLKDILKEARMLQKVRCSKIAEFIGVCSKQIAIMIEYEYFDFPPFGLDHHLSDLLDFLHCLDRVKTISDAFEHFLPMFPKVALDIAEGVALFHAKDIIHRDLKPENVLVSNKHYLNKNPNQFAVLYRAEPVICKLTDLGASSMFRDLIEQDLSGFNQIREVRRYDALECMQVLKKEGVIQETTELMEKILSAERVFSLRVAAMTLSCSGSRPVF